jgi:hypothetical protein
MRLSIYVRDELGDKLRKEAKEKSVKVSHLLGEIIQAYYTHPTNEQVEITPYKRRLFEVQLEAKDKDIK